MGWYDRKVRRVRDLSCGDTRIFLELEVRRIDCRRCGKVKRERLDFLADNPLYTKRFGYYVGRRCRAGAIKDVARELGLDWHTVKALEMQYMQAQLKRAGTPGPRAIGIDEIAIRKGHSYRIVVSDLDRGRPIWFGGEDRSAASMSQFYAWLGARKSRASGLPSWTCGSRCALAVGICAQHLRHVPDRRRLGLGLAPLGGHLSAFCLESHEIALSRLRSSTSAARAFIWLSIADRAVPVLPRLAATSIAGFMRVLDALWVGLEGYKPHLPQRGRAHQKRMYSSAAAALSS